MPKTLASPTVIISMLYFVFVVAASPARAEEPSLSETLAWMESTYNPHTAAGGAGGHGQEEGYIDGKPFKLRNSTFTYNGCQLSLHTQDDPTSPTHSELYNSTLFNFNLQDIDPNSITLYGPWMKFETRNEAALIDQELHIVWPKRQGSEHEVRETTKIFVAAFYLDDGEYADRFVKAFRHAVALCGGKPSPF